MSGRTEPSPTFPGPDLGRRGTVAAVTVGVLLALGALGALFPDSAWGTVAGAVFDTGTATSALRLSVPSAASAMGTESRSAEETVPAAKTERARVPPSESGNSTP